MQQQQKTISIDVSEMKNYKKIVPQKQILTSHEASWQNIILEHHRQPPHEMPEMNFQQHTTHTYSQFEENIIEIIAFIEANFNRNLKLAKIAEVVGLSEYYFDRLFKKFTGITPHQYLVTYHPNCAKEMLGKEKTSIKEITGKCGFGTPSYFVRLFREVVRVTPKVYRDKL